MADPVAAPATFLEWLFGGILVLASALATVIFKKTDDRIDSIEKRMDEKADTTALAAQHAEYEQNRQEIRQDIISIHQKIDSMGRDLHTQISTNQSTLLAAIATIKK